MNEIKEKKPEPVPEIKGTGPEKEKVKKARAEKIIFFKREDASRWLPFTLFLFVVVVFYISLQQYAERLVRKTEKVNREIKELRSEYLSTKSELMQESMQTDIAKKLEESGLKELREPAIKLKLEIEK